MNGSLIFWLSSILFFVAPYSQSASVEVPNINNLAQACINKKNDHICETLSQALYDIKDFEQRSMELMLEKVHFGKFEYITLTGLSFLVHRKVQFKNKSIFSDSVQQKIEFYQNEAIFSFEYQF